MKVLLCCVALLLTTTLLAKENHYYTCTAKVFRNDMGVTPVNSVFYFYLTKEDNGSLSIKDFIGHVMVGEKAEEAYYNIFNLSKAIPADTNYKPTKYKGATRFSNINNEQSSSSSESGMWGELVIEQAGKPTTPAHYILKAGDHLGGTIDYACMSSL